MSAEAAPVERSDPARVTPGLIEPDIAAVVPTKALERLPAAISVRRIGRRDEVARVVGFLAADARDTSPGKHGPSTAASTCEVVAPARIAERDLVLRPCRLGERPYTFSDDKGDAMKTRTTQPDIYGTPVVADSRSFPPTQRELVIASLLACPDAHGSKGTG